MSVLKYNNNGTWEGLNIDHASTADSALYDADGNVISSTYLPLSAGSNKRIVGDVYIDAGSDGWRGIDLERNGVREGTVAIGNYNNQSYFIASGQDGNGNLTNGVQGLDNSVYLFGSGGNVYLRPNGASSATGQVYFDTSGQQVGGHKFAEQVDSADRLLSTSWQTLFSVSLTAGIYIIEGQLTIDPNSKTSNDYFSLHIADTSVATYDSFYIARQATHFKNSTGQYGANCTALVNVASTRTFSLVLWCPIAGLKHKGSKLAYIRIA